MNYDDFIKLKNNLIKNGLTKNGLTKIKGKPKLLNQKKIKK